MLVGHHHKGLSAVQEPVDHIAVVGSGLVAQVHKLDPKGQQTGVGKPLLDEFPPPGSLLLGYLGVTVARQVHEIQLVVDAEIVDMGGLAGSGAHPGQVFPV